MGRKPESSRRTPSFFKVLFGTPHFSKLMKIPPAFVDKHFNGVFPKEIVLKSPDRGIQHVNVKRVEDDLFLDKGWRSFVQNNSLQWGDFLIFHYTGNSEFNVTIYGKNGIEKEEVVATGNSNDVIFIDSDSSSDDDSGPASSPHDQSRSKEFHSLQGPVALEGKNSALEAASKFVSDNPFFKLEMTRRYRRRSGLDLYVPLKFARENFGDGNHSITLRVSKRSWAVKMMICHKKNMARMSAGTAAFLRDNAVQDGDVCIFELILSACERGDIELKVSIFRCAAA